MFGGFWRHFCHLQMGHPSTVVYVGFSVMRERHMIETPDQGNFSSAACLWGDRYQLLHSFIPRGWISKLEPSPCETGVFSEVDRLWQFIAQGIITCGWFAGNAQGSLFVLTAFSNQKSLRSVICALLLHPVPRSSLLTTSSLGCCSSPYQINSETFWGREGIEMYSSADISSQSQAKI